MRPEPNTRLERYRTTHQVLGGSPYGVNYGYFEAESRSLKCGSGLLRIVSSGTPFDGAPDWPYEHVSVSLIDRCPTWSEMDAVKDLFWREDEAVVQFHVPKEAHVNYHEFCLHLWRNVSVDIALPNSELVGPKVGWKRREKAS